MFGNSTTRIIFATILALVLGPSLGGIAPILGAISQLIVNMIKGFAGPLLALAILSTILQANVSLKHGMRMVVITTINASAALVLGLFVSHFVNLRAWIELPTLIPTNPSTTGGQKIDFLKAFIGYFPTNWLQPFVENSLISIIILALLLGTALRVVQKRGHAIESISQGIETLYQAFQVILEWLIFFIPLAVFGSIGKVVAEHGYQPFVGLLIYVVVIIATLALHVLVVYQAWIRLYIRMSLVTFWKTVAPALTYAFGSNSSLATLPLTLKTLKKLGASPQASTLGACVGTNLNNDGILLYEFLAALFICQIAGINLDMGQKMFMAISCVIAAIGVAGVPEAGFVSLSLVLATLGLPMEYLPLLLSVDWIIARSRSMTNTLADITVSLAIDGPTAKRP